MAPLTPLDGITVIDLSQNLPGPWLTQVLQSLGAWVVKVEPPSGEGLRWMPPHHRGANVAFGAVNAGKSSVAIDLKRPEGQAVLKAMLAKADVLVESFRPGVLRRLGLDPDALRAAHPRLVICSVTGFGQQGTLAAKPGHDINFLARSGLLSMSGPTDDAPSMPPVQIADIGGGSLPGVIGVLAALMERDRTGEGRHLDISLARGVLSFGAMALPITAMGHHEEGGDGFLTGGLPCYRTYQTADGRALAVGALEPKFWMAFCQAADRPDLIPKGFDRRPEAHAEIENLVGSRTLDDWADLLASVDCCVEPVATMAEALDDPFIAEQLPPDEGGLPHVRPEVGAPVRVPTRPAGSLGADVHDVAARLGLDATQLGAAADAGALLVPTPEADA
jgi:crotonobetainyl-CoA:carnitine CoA-transferase CaiB-like acyl-CoA transferase